MHVFFQLIEEIKLTTGSPSHVIPFNLTLPLTCKAGIPNKEQGLAVFFGFEFHGIPYKQISCANNLQFQPALLSGEACYTFIACNESDKEHHHQLSLKITGQSGKVISIYDVNVFTKYLVQDESVPSLWKDYDIADFEVCASKIQCI